MTILSDRWPGFGRIPYVRIAELPTAVEPLEALSTRHGAELWVKRDDLASARYGGNKVRKLEYVLGETLAERADTIVTTGAAGSHHALATAIFAEDLRVRVDVVAFPQPWSPHAESQLRALLDAGAQVHPIRSPAMSLAAMRALAARLRLRGRRPHVVPPGGSSRAGIIGHVEAGLELSRQIESREMPEPHALFVPLGTGGTAAGLAVGLAAAGLTTQVVAVRVVPRAVANAMVMGSMVKRAVAHLRALDARFPDVVGTARALLSIDGEEYGDGYGAPTPYGRAATRAAATAGLELDPTYTAKAFAAMLRQAANERAGQRLLFVHTLSATHPGRSEGPRLPKNLRKLLRR